MGTSRNAEGEEEEEERVKDKEEGDGSFTFESTFTLFRTSNPAYVFVGNQWPGVRDE